jgi:Uncharacterized conserved protein|tara:strand:+ start:612 stop:848 length:237 start_codon:yes stop_codon:yes gene_type:complete
MLKRCALRMIIAWRKSPSAKIQKMRKGCLYTPSCSAYTFTYIRRHGLLRGAWNGLLRIKRCDARKYKGGHDPVPKRIS